MTDNKTRLWQTDWVSGTKYKCEYCGKLEYTDYYCGGCDECCNNIIDQEMAELGGKLDEGQK